MNVFTAARMIVHFLLAGRTINGNFDYLKSEQNSADCGNAERRETGAESIRLACPAFAQSSRIRSSILRGGETLAAM